MRGIVSRSSGAMPNTSTPLLADRSVAITCPFTSGAARVTPGTSATRADMSW
ncbi:hypothetical protein Wenmar_02731 [Wenxinia marina DSM 24838]|uniref:Uncharacterized protein n=1 Tax=Wenxinia marina DSM 24838 TaxID=1123501 RepID=A0A0D0PAD2_9RHOB|nr:hypothetical protein Wenmar_02731 [Wenxinia marina DSM 24838]